jgi:hypothetical protein
MNRHHTFAVSLCSISLIERGYRPGVAAIARNARNA